MRSKKRPKLSFPKKVAVFPLPNAILFPDVDLPLYIFEPRYREMLKDSLEGSKMIAVSLLEEGWEDQEEPYPCHNVISVGYVRAAISNRDGTSHIVLRGIGRARIKRYLQLNPYRIAEITQLKDRVSNRETVPLLAKKLKELFLKKARLASETPQQRVGQWRELDEPRFLANLCAFTAQIDFQEKQKLLEMTDLSKRLKILVDLLQEELFPKSSMN